MDKTTLDKPTLVPKGLSENAWGDLEEVFTIEDLVDWVNMHGPIGDHEVKEVEQRFYENSKQIVGEKPVAHGIYATLGPEELQKLVSFIIRTKSLPISLHNIVTAFTEKQLRNTLKL